MGFPHGSEYVIAWLVYVLAGCGCCLVWWRLTRRITNPGWRDLARGMAVVLVFTPWYIGETPEYYAPATFVLMMNVLLEGTVSGIRGGFVLLLATFLMLMVLTIRLWRRRKASIP